MTDAEREDYRRALVLAAVAGYCGNPAEYQARDAITIAYDAIKIANAVIAALDA